MGAERRPGRWWLDRARTASSCCVLAGPPAKSVAKGRPSLGGLCRHFVLAWASIPFAVRCSRVILMEAARENREPPLFETPRFTLSSEAGLGDPSPNLLRCQSAENFERDVGHPRPRSVVSAVERSSVAPVVILNSGSSAQS